MVNATAFFVMEFPEYIEVIYKIGWCGSIVAKKFEENESSEGCAYASSKANDFYHVKYKDGKLWTVGGILFWAERDLHEKIEVTVKESNKEAYDFFLDNGNLEGYYRDLYE